jgi:hypothetical protein
MLTLSRSTIQLSKKKIISSKSKVNLKPPFIPKNPHKCPLDRYDSSYYTIDNCKYSNFQDTIATKKLKDYLEYLTKIEYYHIELYHN